MENKECLELQSKVSELITEIHLLKGEFTQLKSVVSSLSEKKTAK